jgi:D-alanine-D-alanine ligase
MNIAVIFGGISTERNVSIAGGKAVVEALRAKGHNVIPIDPAFGKNFKKAEELMADISTFPSLEELKSLDTRNYIESVNSEAFDNIDVAFIVLHGKNGEDGLIQALLELRGIPYTGSGVKSCAIAIDKATSKNLFGAAGLLTPEWVHLHKNDIDNEELLKQIRKGLGNKVVIKPNYQGSSIGITIVKNGNLDEINEGLKLAAEYSDSIIVERFIEGREITVGLLGGEALPVIEIIPEEDYYDYKHKYTKGHTRYECPADIPEDIAEFAQSVSVICNNIIGAEGFARVDFRLTDEGEPYLLELNSIPGFTSTSLVPMAAKYIGIEFPDLCEKIINLTLNKDK